jgi:hypothetical protein
MQIKYQIHEESIGKYLVTIYDRKLKCYTFLCPQQEVVKLLLDQFIEAFHLLTK